MKKEMLLMTVILIQAWGIFFGCVGFLRLFIPSDRFPFNPWLIAFIIPILAFIVAIPITYKIYKEELEDK